VTESRVIATIVEALFGLLAAIRGTLGLMALWTVIETGAEGRLYTYGVAMGVLGAISILAGCCWFALAGLTGLGKAPARWLPQAVATGIVAFALLSAFPNLVLGWGWL